MGFHFGQGINPVFLFIKQKGGAYEKDIQDRNPIYFIFSLAFCLRGGANDTAPTSSWH
jgi:hypothetical protein